MNYCDKIDYTIHKSKERSFDFMVKELMAQLPDDRSILRLIVFGAPNNNVQFVEQREYLRARSREKFGDQMPALTYVSQPPLEGGLVMEVHSYIPEEKDIVHYDEHEGYSYVIVENECARLLFAGGFQADLSTSILNQSREVFRLIGGLLEKEKFPISSITRQWNYIERITAWDGKNQHYQMFNNARGEFYALARWENGYPAATGIGATKGGVSVDIDAAIFQSKCCFATPINNKLQVAAHEYSSDVLKEAGNEKATPKFERAKSMTFGERSLVYISGTAAIRGEESLKDVGVKRQMNVTIDNISQLIGNAKIRMLRVYLKNPEDYEIVKQHLLSYEQLVPISYLWADVCRNELLIEIEGIAMV
ncbi:MAG: endoribonuclease L-PSP [Fermentimonas sp.]|jgi:hypothetical protein